ncbi:phosphate transport system substrate-binding protein [Rhodovulum iodosum]|uniref:Phosphate transport system substrate-binding protein n=1 Tax=Rhodovulum iodosum TaxID=68291 RepID=A0ABV3XRR9_9RHOB|nr:phosphate ABC transporter substrate-binding/OmpA family protein [Rhodovulum robiginosum]RSK30366.1 cell envelope biogenesis protein OmpA [Rhodovulum robiginosum]
MRFFPGAAFIAAFFLCFCLSAAQAQEVTLKSRDGAVTIHGTLRGFDGEFYRVETIYGLLTVDGQRVLCDGAACPGPEARVAAFAFSGAREMGQVLMPALVEAYAAERGLTMRRRVEDAAHFTYALRDAEGATVARIRFRATTTDEGFADLLAGEADLVMAARPASPTELALARDAGLGDLADPARRRVVALDAVVPVVARDNPVTEIDEASLRAVLTGEITDWGALGGPDGAIALHGLAPGAGLLQTVARRLETPLPAQHRHADSAALADAVAADPAAFGLAYWSEAGNARALSLAGGCGMPARATRQSIKTEDYPLTAPLFLYSAARRMPPFARAFLAFLDTPDAQAVIRRAGYVDLSREAIPLAHQGQRLAYAIAAAGDEVPLSELKRLVTRVEGAARLTPTFRFEGGEAQLDAQSFANIAALARAIEAGAFQGQTLMFLGFSDGRGPAAANRGIARARAEAVRDAVMAAATLADRSHLRILVDAFGEALPNACDEFDWGRRANRRVEVWLR